MADRVQFLAIARGRNFHYLGSWAKNKKNNDTLISQTLKVEEKKVSLVFYLRPRSRDITFSSLEALDERFELSQDEEIANISAPEPQIKKVSKLCSVKL